jgi:hypothetical protein
MTSSQVLAEVTEARAEFLASIEKHIDIRPGVNHEQLEEQFNITDTGELLNPNFSLDKLRAIAEWVEDIFPSQL